MHFHFSIFWIFIKWPILSYTHFFLGSLVPSLSPSHKRRRREGEGGDLLINNSGILKPSFSPPVAKGEEAAGKGGGESSLYLVHMFAAYTLKLYHTHSRFGGCVPDWNTLGRRYKTDIFPTKVESSKEDAYVKLSICVESF